MIAEARRHSGLVRSIFAEQLPEYCLPKSEWEQSFRTWASRCEALHPIALVILKSLAIQSSRVRL